MLWAEGVYTPLFILNCPQEISAHQEDPLPRPGRLGVSVASLQCQAPARLPTT